MVSFSWPPTNNLRTYHYACITTDVFLGRGRGGRSEIPFSASVHAVTIATTRRSWYKYGACAIVVYDCAVTHLTERSVDGVRTQEWGLAADQPSVVMVHGGAHGSWAFENVGPRLAEEGWHSVALNWLNHNARTHFESSL